MRSTVCSWLVFVGFSCVAAACAGTTGGSGGASDNEGGAAGDGDGGTSGRSAQPAGGGTAGATTPVDPITDAGMAPGPDGKGGGSGARFDARPADGGGGSIVDAQIPPEPPQGWVPSVVAVGYGGFRVLSRDKGLTWTHQVVQYPGCNSGCDNGLIRGVTYGGGLYVAAGWGFFISPDGMTWTARDTPTKNWLGGIAYGNGMFVAAGYSGWSVYSRDGVTWTMKRIGTDQDHFRSVAFGDGKFATSGDGGNGSPGTTAYESPDGINWTQLPQRWNSIAYCKGAFRPKKDCLVLEGNGFSLRANGRSIQRSTNGTTWTTVYNVPNDFYTGGDFFAAGFSPAP